MTYVNAKCDRHIAWIPDMPAPTPESDRTTLERAAAKPTTPKHSPLAKYRICLFAPRSSVEKHKRRRRSAHEIMPLHHRVNLPVSTAEYKLSRPALRAMAKSCAWSSKRDDWSLTLLRQQESKPLLQRHPLPRPLVIGREARRVGRLGDLAVGNFFERVHALAISVERVHKMHLEAKGGTE